MEIPTIKISPDASRKLLTDAINEFIRIEKSVTGLAYQQKSNFIRGQISLITAFIGEEWSFKETGQSYFEFLKYLVNKYRLDGVWKINDL
ncbi:hypothetical protein [Bacillus atrophaeus]|uniref:hypothetical protein n=1 Tax=Bacillus atrophaeus TaxID=1452 RepID=UPI00077AC5A8|nr:hypothetical protein [Bacillus atrophaeus]KXZ13256.1 hypothetical protein AXI57_16000 [Bacillus atrophaeus]MED4806337.1 hypothetical protein [Bacillus atrophaeus]UFD97636.1 hypothetical protein [Bacillus atrophaeus]GED04214.1 hypothetical protein BAT02nite_38580 [Bacillus atrophaeus]